MVLELVQGAPMKPTQLLFTVTCIAALAGCASTKEVTPPPPPPPPPSMATFLHQADVAVKAGKSEDAVATLKVATRIYPANKAAWLRIAQISFDCHEYGEAISHAKKVIERDPDDILAHSIAAVSGLRVSSKALADLTVKKKIPGDVRDAAHNLAKILRTSIGGEIIPAKGERKGHGTKTASPAQGAPVAKNSADDLLDLLNRPNEPVRK